MVKQEIIDRERAKAKEDLKRYYEYLKTWRPNQKNNKCPICKEVYDLVRQPCCYEIFDHGTWICKETPASCCPDVKDKVDNTKREHYGKKD